MPYTGSKKKEGVDFKNLDPISFPTTRFAAKSPN
jgi:hypothetical protein